MVSVAGAANSSCVQQKLCHACFLMVFGTAVRVIGPFENSRCVESNELVL